jgi:ubiquinone/menaquinone biosynthesis C-methylase UbiE
MGYGNIHSYGETPLPALEKIVRAFDITSAEKWLEIGSGRGRGCFWISEVWGCRGIEWVPTFVSKASWIAERIPSCLSQFEEISMYDADFSWPDVVYLCGTCMNSQEIKKLLCSMRILQKGAKVITISEPFNHPDYQLVKSISVSFIWGDTEAYLQIKKAPSK